MKYRYAFITAQALILAGIISGYWLFSLSYLRLHFLAMANLFSASLFINFAFLYAKGKSRFYMAMLSSSILVLGFFFSAGFISGSYMIFGYALFLIPAVLTLISGLGDEL